MTWEKFHRGGGRGDIYSRGAFTKRGAFNKIYSEGEGRSFDGAFDRGGAFIGIKHGA